MKWWQASLRRFLLLILLGGVSVWWVGVTLWVYVKARHEVAEIYDANLAQTARALLKITEFTHERDDPHDLESPTDDAGHHYETKLAFVVAEYNRNVLLDSPAAPPFMYHAPDNSGFRTVSDGTRHTWRVFCLWDKEHGIAAQTAERYDVRREMEHEIVESVLTPLLYALPMLAAFIWIGIGRGLRYLQVLSEAIAQRTPKKLQQIDIKDIQREIQPLGVALNELFARLERAFANERRFTADAAHELRTPLAGIRIQAEVARRSRDPTQQRQALEQIEHGVAHATHLLTQLLALARIDAAQQLVMETVDLKSARCASNWRPVDARRQKRP